MDEIRIGEVNEPRIEFDFMAHVVIEAMEQGRGIVVHKGPFGSTVWVNPKPPVMLVKDDNNVCEKE